MIQFSPEQTAQHINGLASSAAVILSASSAGERTPELLTSVNRNIRHLEIMLSMSHIQTAGTDLTPYEAAISAGKAWLAAS